MQILWLKYEIEEIWETETIKISPVTMSVEAGVTKKL